tara:strand:+ start:210 stop:437 length:228 start_codon:yes stop_codon:yes gene_type:complete
MIDYNGLKTDLEIVGNEIHTKQRIVEGKNSFDFVYSDVVEDKETIDNIVKSYFVNDTILKSDIIEGIYKGVIYEL